MSYISYTGACLRTALYRAAEICRGNRKEIYGLTRSMPFDHSGFKSTDIVDLVLQT